MINTFKLITSTGIYDFFDFKELRKFINTNKANMQVISCGLFCNGFFINEIRI